MALEMFDDDRTNTIIGFIIVLIVAVNILFVFGDIIGKGGIGNIFTGFASGTSCVDIDSGISCGSTIFIDASNGCPSGTSKACTNTCELERAINSDTRVCPSYCKDVCVTSDVKSALGK